MNRYFHKILLITLAGISFSSVDCAQANLVKTADGYLPETSAANSSVQNLRTKTDSMTSPKPTPKKVPVANAVCPDPKKPCHHKTREFEDWELPFHLPAKIKLNVAYKSASFYAVILKNYQASDCGDVFDYAPLIETERNKAQKLFPTRKFFAEYSCPNLDTVIYDFAGKRDEKGEHVLYMDYIAVYAGETLDEANKLLRELRGKFPKAEVKKMMASYTQLAQ
jgi:hypothetical protein